MPQQRVEEIRPQTREDLPLVGIREIAADFLVDDLRGIF